ncbi:MAG: hypothetical protein AAGL49_11020 [Pseudomonadota bacterium]
MLLRSSGGSCVPHGRGVLNFTMVQRVGDETRTSEVAYSQICSILIESFGSFGLRAHVGAVDGSICNGDWNVCIDGLKVAGVAQRRRAISVGTVILTHAAVLLRPPSSIYPAIQLLFDDLYRPEKVLAAAHYSAGGGKTPRAPAVSEFAAILETVLEAAPG